MLRLSLLLVSALLLTYPLAIYYGLQYLEPRYIGFIGFLLVSLRFLIARKKFRWTALRPFLPATLASALLWLFLVFVDEPRLIFINPVLVNLVMLLLFAASLFYPPSMIERIARLTDGDLPHTAVAYTRKVTIVWCLFFFVNGMAAAYTGLFASMEVWAMYNGLIVYIIIGLLFGIEYCVRIQRRRASEA
jgi:uncharacterized membrane protein